MSDGHRPRQSLLLPIAIPLGALVVIGLALFGFSRVLLSVSHTAATVTALIAAVGIMVVASIVASRKEAGGTALLSLVGGVLGVSMLAGGGALLFGQHEEGEGPPGFVVALSIPVDGASEGFQPTQLEGPAGAPFVIELTSEDTIVHNVEIAQAEGEPTLVKGPDITGPGAVDVPVEALEAGDYFFFCFYHPTTMTGTLTVAEGVAPPGEGGEGGGPTVVAQGTAFETDTIELPAEEPTTVTFDNADPGQTHNIAIYTDDTASNVLFDGSDVVGPATVVYEVPPLDAGEYFFRCDIHPIMEGQVVVGGPPPEGGNGPPPDEEGGGPPEDGGG